jgi:hypothetical protein
LATEASNGRASSHAEEYPSNAELAKRPHCQISRIAISSRAEVISIVAETAMP